MDWQIAIEYLRKGTMIFAVLGIVGLGLLAFFTDVFIRQ
jgi:hypothetical protein